VALCARGERLPRSFKTGRPEAAADRPVRGHRFAKICIYLIWQSLTQPQTGCVATSSAIRTILREHPKLKDTLRTIDGLRGSAREEALHARLGISTRGGIGNCGLGGDADGDDDGMGELASAIERGVREKRGNRDGVLGLDWSVDDPERE
jgi:hypothetical protein